MKKNSATRNWVKINNYNFTELGKILNIVFILMKAL